MRAEEMLVVEVVEGVLGVEERILGLGEGALLVVAVDRDPRRGVLGWAHFQSCYEVSLESAVDGSVSPNLVSRPPLLYVMSVTRWPLKTLYPQG